MNVKVDTVDVADGHGQTIRKKILVMTKDCKAGEIIYKVCRFGCSLYGKFSLPFVHRKTQSSQSSISTSNEKVPTAPTVSDISKQT